MAILAFQKPDKVIMLEGTDTVGRFEFRPLEPGYAQTIGNALRRILLSSLEGFAINSVRISGVDQEFATIPGVIEGMQDIILNLKQVRFKRMVETVDSEVANIVISGKQEFTAEDISKGLSSFKVLNPELHICSLETAVKLEISLNISKGRGFVPADENRDENTPIGTIPVDAIYTPIVNVNWSMENWRVEQKTDYEKLNLEIVTDGSITPNVALQEAANILIYHFKLFTDDRKLSLESAVESDSKELDEESLRMRHLLLAAFATSVDAFAVGVSLAMTGMEFYPAISLTVAVFAMTVLAAVFGVVCGSLVGCRFGTPARVAGGLVLIAIGIRLLI